MPDARLRERLQVRSLLVAPGIHDLVSLRLAIFPVSALLAAVKAMAGTYAHMKLTGSSKGVPVELEDFAALTRLLGFEDVLDFEKRHAE